MAGAGSIQSTGKSYARYREILLSGLPELGLGRLAPADGAFYVYADVTRFTADSTALCHDLLHKCGVATTPGIDFDPENGPLSLRLSYAGAEADMIDALRRMKVFFARR